MLQTSRFQNHRKTRELPERSIELCPAGDHGLQSAEAEYVSATIALGVAATPRDSLSATIETNRYGGGTTIDQCDHHLHVRLGKGISTVSVSASVVRGPTTSGAVKQGRPHFQDPLSTFGRQVQEALMRMRPCRCLVEI